jgi:glycosyltransferase involved in cell wall biosynthesis
LSGPFVSIVIPTYDRVGMVETAIMSVLEQDYDDLEVVAVDDGSHDETPALLERIAQHADPGRFRWSVQENMGQAVALNRAWADSRGDLIGYVSSDDYLLPGAISKLVAASIEHPEADVFYPWELVVDEADRTIDVLEHLTHRYVDAVRWALCSIGVGALVRRSRFDTTGGWDSTLRLIPDFDWWLRMHDATFVCVQEPLGARRRHSGSIRVGLDPLEDMQEWLLVLDRVFAREDLPAEVLEVKSQAYSSALINTVHELQIRDPATVDDPRFVVQDMISPRYSVAHRTSIEDERTRILAALRSAEEGLATQTAVIDELRRTIGTLEGSARLRDERISALDADQKRLLEQMSGLAAERDALAAAAERRAEEQDAGRGSPLRRLRGSR